MKPYRKRDDPVDTNFSTPLFPRGRVVFKTWRMLRWFLLLLVPVVANALVLWLYRGRPGVAAFLFLFGDVLALDLVLSLFSGRTSNTGRTFDRRTSPLDYWITIALIILAFLAMGCGYLFYLAYKLAGFRL